jgi:hypothetical protein
VVREIYYTIIAYAELTAVVLFVSSIIIGWRFL